MAQGTPLARAEGRVRSHDPRPVPAMIAPASELRDEINKRLTLNLLIQGIAEHALHHTHDTVRTELAAIDKKLPRLYDQFVLFMALQYWYPDSIPQLGWTKRFWRRVSDPRHPFHDHPLLSRHGERLALASRDRAFATRRRTGVTRIPLWFSVQATLRLVRILWKEARHEEALVDLAKRTTQAAWGIPCERLDGELTQAVAFGQLSKPRSLRGVILRLSAAGYGGVLEEADQIQVVGRAWVWPLLAHELVKGTVELVCMHGLATLDEATYREVIRAADRIEYEPWMLQAGPELWRRMQPLLPPDRPVSEIMMHLARLPARSLQCLVLAVIEEPVWAQELLAGLR